jgi:hypothetical protein
VILGAVTGPAGDRHHPSTPTERSHPGRRSRQPRRDALRRSASSTGACRVPRCCRRCCPSAVERQRPPEIAWKGWSPAGIEPATSRLQALCSALARSATWIPTDVAALRCPGRGSPGGSDTSRARSPEDSGTGVIGVPEPRNVFADRHDQAIRAVRSLGVPAQLFGSGPAFPVAGGAVLPRCLND